LISSTKNKGIDMSVYMVFEREATKNPDEMALYGEKVGAARGNHPMTPVVFNGKLDLLEGGPVENVVILSFPSAEEARAWYDSPAYQAALKHRQAGSDHRVYIVEAKA
jgi:uncharacterized protein (DUF1330 family)